ncbi:MAG: hypothetical protein ACOY3P_21670 [Planctomycetota bacterium]
MSGAYVAKPTPVVPPVLPPGWNPDWPHPGPLPPGYAPDYSLAVTAPDSIGVGDPLNLAVRLFDHGSYKTAQPDEASRIAWSATIDGEPIPLRFEGSGEYLQGVQSPYAGFGGFWGAEPALELQLAQEHNGKTLVLLAQSNVFGEALLETQEIAIGGLSLELAVTWLEPPTVGEQTLLNVSVSLERDDYSLSANVLAGFNWVSQELGYQWWSMAAQAEGIDVAATNLSATFAAEDLGSVGGASSSPLSVKLQFLGELAASSMSAVLEIRSGETVVGTYSTTLVITAGETEKVKSPWLKVNTETGEVTVIIP